MVVYGLTLHIRKLAVSRAELRKAPHAEHPEFGQRPGGRLFVEITDAAGQFPRREDSASVRDGKGFDPGRAALFVVGRGASAPAAGAGARRCWRRGRRSGGYNGSPSAARRAGTTSPPSEAMASIEDAFDHWAALSRAMASCVSPSSSGTPLSPASAGVTDAKGRPSSRRRNSACLSRLPVARRIGVGGCRVIFV